MFITYLEALSRNIIALNEPRQTAILDRICFLLVVASIVDLKHNVLESKLQRILRFLRILASKRGFLFLLQRTSLRSTLGAQCCRLLGDCVILESAEHVLTQNRTDVIQQTLVVQSVRGLTGLGRVDVAQLIGLEILKALPININ